jgi:hypothetical protein
MPSSQTPATWLFSRNDETIWIIRPEAYLLLMFGPGSVRRQYRFAGDAELQSFQIALAKDLTTNGWILWATDRDRRQAERRRTTRGTTDRRVLTQETEPALADDRVRL